MAHSPTLLCSCCGRGGAGLERLQSALNCALIALPALDQLGSKAQARRSALHDGTRLCGAGGSPSAGDLQAGSERGVSPMHYAGSSLSSGLMTCGCGACVAGVLANRSPSWVLHGRSCRLSGVRGLFGARKPSAAPAAHVAASKAPAAGSRAARLSTRAAAAVTATDTAADGDYVEVHYTGVYVLRGGRREKLEKVQRSCAVPLENERTSTVPAANLAPWPAGPSCVLFLQGRWTMARCSTPRGSASP